jgi:hypothetical protein
MPNSCVATGDSTPSLLNSKGLGLEGRGGREERPNCCLLWETTIRENPNAPDSYQWLVKKVLAQEM